MAVLDLVTPTKSSAAGPYLGYSLEQLRLCYHLLTAPDGDSVSLEYMDDTAIHRSDGSVLLEQSKSALSGNPAADRSIELWKALSNWANMCANNEVDISSTTFTYYVTPTKPGSIIRTMHTAVNHADATQILDTIKKLENKKKPLVGCGPYLSDFLSHGDALCTNIISRFSFVEEQDPLDGIRSYVRVSVPAEVVDDIVSAAVGIARDRIDRLIRTKSPQIISSSQYRRSYQTFLQRFNVNGFLPSTGPTPTHTDISAVVSSAPTFVRQLQAIEVSHDLLITAVSDYMRATSDKVHWADEGLILEDSLSDLDAKLARRHLLIRDDVEDQFSTYDKKRRGREVYRGCLKTVVPLEGRVLPDHFIAGEYNDLSNRRLLGWHPQYADLFPPEDQ